MKQYISKSAVVAEIERRRNICKKVVLDLRTEENKDYYQGKAEAYKEALDFLDSLQEEPVSEDLGEYISELSKQFPEVSFAKLSRIAVRVAKWQKDNTSYRL